MSIKIDTNLAYLQSRLNISDDRWQMYAEKTLEEILEAEAAAGNQEAVKLAADMFTDVNQLIELFQLGDVNNKLVILSEMNSEQLKKLIPMLEEKDLVQGLNFFTKTGLLNMLKDIPKKELLNSVFEMFSEEQLVDKLPERELDRLFKSTELDKGFVLANISCLQTMYIQQILESVTGQETEGSKQDLILQLGQLSDSQYQKALTNLHPTQKRELTFQLTSRNKNLYQVFDTTAYAKIIEREKNKDDIVQSMGAIKPEYLEKMIEKLPDDLMSVVLTQVDTTKFADALINKFPELLAQLVAR